MLYLVPTPIGNLEDITLRALRVLKEVDVILAEDTRVTKKLLSHYDIKTPVKPYHAHNEHKMASSIIADLERGGKIALVSDAGSPGISDPGFLIVRDCLHNNIDIEVLPGATALIPAIVKSGFPNERFIFEGFMPHKKGRQTRFEEIKNETRTAVFYESPHRLLKFLEQAKEFLGDERQISVSRELTKMFEETINGTASELLNYFNEKGIKGEFVICIKGIEK